MEQIWNELEEQDMTPRQKALMATAIEIGARPKELERLQVGDITERDGVLTVSISGPQKRRVPMVAGQKHLRRWLRRHQSGDGSTSLWGIPKEQVQRELREAARQLGFENPSDIRHYSATHHAAFSSKEELNLRFGWSTPERKHSEVEEAVERSMNELVEKLDKLIECKVAEVVLHGVRYKFKKPTNQEGGT